jgi:hypothetical protein
LHRLARRDVLPVVFAGGLPQFYLDSDASTELPVLEFSRRTVFFGRAI